MINLANLSPETYKALENLSEKRHWPDLYYYMAPEQIAWLVIKLEFIPDSTEVFPKGKWATIQRLQEMVREAARLACVSGVREGDD